jgi:hypothetical protein
MMNPIIAFRSFANAPENKTANSLRVLSNEVVFFTKPAVLHSVRILSDIWKFHYAC